MPLAGGQPFFGSPTKVFEYMALGRAVVASRLGQIDEVIEDGRSGRLVPAGSVSDRAVALADLAGSPERREELGRNARRSVEDAHTWDHRAAAILDAVTGR